MPDSYIELRAVCESSMRLDVCSGCDACGLRCAEGVPSSRDEWTALSRWLTDSHEDVKAYIAVVEAQDKRVDLGDDVTVTMCRYRDMESSRCAVYPVRPLACRLLGHVEWMPCPINLVPEVLPTPLALRLMSSYAMQERKTFEAWEREGLLPKSDDGSIALTVSPKTAPV